MSKINPKVDFYFTKGKWQEEIKQLRHIVLDSGLEEELKWGVPCYTLDGRNVVLIHVFKDYCAILFVKGALLTDSKQVLIQQTKSVQAARQIRFSNMDEILKLEPAIKAYIREATKIEKAGLKVELKRSPEPIPNEFKSQLDSNGKLKAAFESLTPGRRRAYILYFSAAKQSKTREARIEKYLPKILNGKGLDD